MAVIGQRATRFHLLLVTGVALMGLGILVLIGAGLFGDDTYTRDMSLLGGIITAPLWIPGILAAVDTASVLRGRRVSVRRAVVWSLGALVLGSVIAASSGQIEVISSLLTEPGRVGFDWPTITLVTADGMGAQFLRMDQAGFWLPLVAIVLGTLSLAAALFDRSGATRPSHLNSTAQS